MQANDFLAVRDLGALLDQDVVDAKAFLIDADLRLAMRHQEAGDANHVRETGRRRLGDDDARTGIEQVGNALREVGGTIKRRVEEDRRARRNGVDQLGHRATFVSRPRGSVFEDLDG